MNEPCKVCPIEDRCSYTWHSSAPVRGRSAPRTRRRRRTKPPSRQSSSDELASLDLGSLAEILRREGRRVVFQPAFRRCNFNKFPSNNITFFMFSEKEFSTWRNDTAHATLPFCIVEARHSSERVKPGEGPHRGAGQDLGPASLPRRTPVRPIDHRARRKYSPSSAFKPSC